MMRIRLSTALLAYGLEGPSASSTVDNLNPQGIHLRNPKSCPNKPSHFSLQVIDRGHQHRPFVLNKNGAEVSAYTFLDLRFNQISAIWAVDLDGGSAIGNSEPMVVIHNPNATSRIQLGFLPADDEYEAVAQGEEMLLCKVP